MDDPSSGSASSPTEKRNQTDPGDETSRRYRYQFGYGVILLVASVRNALDYKAIWCEQHEDFLGEISEELFDAYQVKTRKAELGVWELSDEELRKSVARFVQLNRDYPKSFRKFRFVSNAKFSVSGAKDREHLSPVKLLDAIQQVTSWGKLEDAAKKGFEYLRERIDAEPEELFVVLKKLDIVNGPTLDDFEDVLAHTHIAQLNECSTLSAIWLGRVRDALIQKIHQASSLVTEDPSQHYVALNSDRRKDPLLRAKRITVDDVTLTVREVRGGTFTYLPSLASLQLGSATGKLDILQKKMVCGGLAHQYEIMRRRALSAEQILFDLVTRSDDGRQLLSQLENVVLGECSDAGLRLTQTPEPFGASMLIEVQDRLQRVAESEPARVHYQPTEMLVGVAGLLTSDCKVWWSKPFNLETLQ